MKVRFVGLGEGESDPWLTGGNVYVVLEVFAGREGIQYRIASGKPPRPVLHPAASFVIVDQKIPKNWVVNVDKSDAFIELAPLAWTERDFWTKFFDNDPDAIAVFESESYKIAVEEEN